MIRNSRVIAQSAIHKMAAREHQSIQLTGVRQSNKATALLFPAEKKCFSSPKRLPSLLYTGYRQPSRVQEPLSSAEIENAWSYTSILAMSSWRAQ